MIITTRRIWFYISSQRKKEFLILFFFGLLYPFVEILSIGLLVPFLTVLGDPEALFSNPYSANIISYFNINDPQSLIGFITTIFVLAIVFASIYKLLFIKFSVRLSYAVGGDIASDVFRAAINQPYSVQVTLNSNSIIDALTIKTGAVIGTINAAVQFLSSLIFLIIALIGLILFNPMMTLSVFGFMSGFYFILAYIVKKRLAINGVIVSSNSSLLIKVVQESFGGIRDIILDNVQNVFCLKYKVVDAGLRSAQCNSQLISVYPRYIMEALGVSIIGFFAYYYAINTTNFLGVVPILGLITLSAQKLLPVLQQIYASWTHLQSNKAAIVDVLEILDGGSEGLIDTSTPVINFRSKLLLDDISFRYSPETPIVLENISINIKKGEIWGFVGQTGCGKSTLLDIIMGLLEPTKGSISIDGKPLNNSNYRQWRKKVAHVPQFIYLADATIAENIAFGRSREEIDHEKLEAVSIQSNIQTFVDSLPQKYNTVVGERGIKFSGGQRQRIGIARALYKGAEVLILDEATSSLDSNTEIQIMDAISKLDSSTTVLIVAHRLSSLRGCNHIVELRNGKIFAIGTFEELIKK